MTSFEDRFWAKVEKGDDCWRWTASLTAAGYGQIHHGSGPVYAHRVSYEFAKGPIPAALQIDHLCRNTACVNPSHLEVVTVRENTLRGIGPTAQHARQTHCKNGHPFEGDNLGRYANGGRKCLICTRAYLNEWRRERRGGGVEAFIRKGAQVYSTAPNWPSDGRPAKRAQAVDANFSGDRIVWAGSSGYWRWVLLSDPQAALASSGEEGNGG